MNFKNRDTLCFDAGIDAIYHIIKTRKNKNKSSFIRLDEDKAVPFVIPSVTWNSTTQIGSLNNEHWVFDVGYAFREALDLIYMARKRNKCKVYLWTQGALISFKEGDLIQTRCGKRSVQVQYANPMGWDEATNDIYYGMVTYQESIFKNEIGRAHV